ncbi:N-acetyl sugar amidotransferase [Litorivicinus sp.]|nr:N-acetyl sugar amidotransferase [Litorivicinus sp.]MDC1239995.1 N-acetyl sugar amidotransferase [Litorivicinus sp.]
MIFCVECVMNTSDPNIAFDDQGVCNHCHKAKTKILRYYFKKEQETENLSRLAASIKKRKVGEYDSILGLSGGVDSSYVAYLAMKMGLNPLCVHFDNGWNSDVAVKNIRNIIDKTGFDLFTFVIDWPEFRDLQRAFLKAGVVDIEILSDHAIFASLFKIRRRHGITTVLSGTNYTTEHGMPGSWVWPKMDLRNIKAIHKRFGDKKIKTFPTMSNFSWSLMKRFDLGGTWAEPLDLITFRKHDAMALLQEEFGWQYYGGKHYESVFTKFYQAYILPSKFNIDKREVHLSALIRNGEISREQAVSELQAPLYKASELKRDKTFVLKKLGFTEQEFDEMMLKDPVPHDFYPTDQKLMLRLTKIGKAIFGTKNKITLDR